MFISNYLNAAIGETFFIFGQLLRTFYPVFEQLFQHSLEQLYILHLPPKTFTEACYIFYPTWETLIFLSFLLIADLHRKHLQAL